MTELERLFPRIEADLRASGAAGESVCRELEALSEDEGGLSEAALAFLGCKNIHLPGKLSMEVPASRRLLVARLMWLRLGGHTAGPTWSSFSLEQLLSAAVAVPGGQIGDVIVALYEILGEHGHSLSETTANLIREVVVTAFTQHRRSYDASDLSRLSADLATTGSRVTPAQAYLVLHTLPEAATLSCRDRILSILRETAYADEALQMLESSE